jgi:hypothetical protein
MKKAKTTKITQMAQKDSYGNTSFVIELDNGDKGFYTSKNENQTKFVVGEVTEYLIEAKEGKKGTYYKITLPQTDVPFQKSAGRPQVEPRINMISFSASYAKDIICAGKAELKDFGTIFEMIYGEMISKL